MSDFSRFRLQPASAHRERRRGSIAAPARALALVLLAVVVVLALSLYLYDHSRRDLIAPGVRAAGIPVGSLHADAARARLQRALSGQLHEPLVVRASGHRIVLPVDSLHPQVDIPGLVSRAVAQSRQGFILSRVWNGLTGQHVNADVNAPVSYSTPALDALVAHVAARIDRPARNAGVSPSVTALHEVPGADGVAVDRQVLRSELVAALGRPGGQRTVSPPLQTLHPRVTTAQLAARYPAYIVIDRADFTLRFYKHLKLYRSYPIAVGMQGLETPAGLYSVQWKQVNPSWYVPNSAWAGALAGRTIPPGPDDPIKARWMAFDGAAGIHGIDPSEYDSIGHTASHGCVRMTIPDVIDLYSMSPVGTPVYIA